MIQVSVKLKMKINYCKNTYDLAGKQKHKMGNVPVSILGLESLGLMFNKQPEMPRHGVQMKGFLASCPSSTAWRALNPCWKHSA